MLHCYELKTWLSETSTVRGTGNTGMPIQYPYYCSKIPIGVDRQSHCDPIPPYNSLNAVGDPDLTRGTATRLRDKLTDY